METTVYKNYVDVAIAFGFVFFEHEAHEFAWSERWFKRDSLTGDYRLNAAEIRATLGAVAVDVFPTGEIEITE